MINFDATILYQFVHFLILLFILNFILFKPVLKALEKRQSAIKGLTDGVEQAKQDTIDLERNYESAFVEKRKPIIGSRDAVISEANKEAVHVVEQARSELSEELAKIKSEIEMEGRKVYDALKGDVGKLSMEAAQKILKRSI
ncbi:MAG: ATP synthase F0 subunit B [Syntrophorhabdus sp.]|jgi:F-type H+-transporting ATPase subunit b|nr:ATP synthase F0 subunit B [Syntrophorhabdus sp.]